MMRGIYQKIDQSQGFVVVVDVDVDVSDECITYTTKTF